VQSAITGRLKEWFGAIGKRAMSVVAAAAIGTATMVGANVAAGNAPPLLEELKHKEAAAGEPGLQGEKGDRGDPGKGLEDAEKLKKQLEEQERLIAEQEKRIEKLIKDLDETTKTATTNRDNIIVLAGHTNSLRTNVNVVSQGVASLGDTANVFNTSIEQLETTNTNLSQAILDTNRTLLASVTRLGETDDRTVTALKTVNDRVCCAVRRSNEGSSTAMMTVAHRGNSLHHLKPWNRYKVTNDVRNAIEVAMIDPEAKPAKAVLRILDYMQLYPNEMKISQFQATLRAYTDPDGRELLDQLMPIILSESLEQR
jgi:hypothetical protein